MKHLLVVLLLIGGAFGQTTPEPLFPPEAKDALLQAYKPGVDLLVDTLNNFDAADKTNAAAIASVKNTVDGWTGNLDQVTKSANEAVANSQTALAKADQALALPRGSKYRCVKAVNQTITAPGNFSGVCTISPNLLVAGDIIELTAYGTGDTTASTVNSNYRFVFKLGTAVLTKNVNGNQLVLGRVAGWSAKLTCAVIAAGSSGQIVCGGEQIGPATYNQNTTHSYEPQTTFFNTSSTNELAVAQTSSLATGAKATNVLFVVEVR